MGCISSQTEENDDDIADADTQVKASKQRRRLSVTGTLVGDITKAKVAADSGLSTAEVKARAGMISVAKTRKGYVPYNANKVNQDRAIVKFAMQNDEDICLFGVADGHGEFGHHVAAFVQEKLPQYLEKQSNLKTDTKAAILTATAGMCEELSKASLDCSYSGTTLVFGVKVGSRIFVANLGDSRCVLARDDGKGGVQAIPLSRDQKPENPEEKKRILEAGGRVHTLPGPPGEDCGPERVWLADADIPGLAMSRSIGDQVAQTVGVSSVPEIKTYDLVPEDLFIIWASDGVWEFITSEEAVGLVYGQKKDLSRAGTELVKESKKRWRAEEEVIDDITTVIVGLKQCS